MNTEPLNVLSLFAGIGGLELGLERAGMRVVGQVEIDDYCRRVLAKHWPDVPRHDDVRTAVDWWTSEPRPRVDVVCGGFPCQPVSEVGQQKAQDDERWLWPAFADVVRGIRPHYVIVENVPGLLDRGMGDVLGDLARIGFDAEWSILSACAMGASHSRERLFIVAYSEGQRQQRGRDTAHEGPPLLASEGLRDSDRGHWPVEPRPNGVAYGLPARVDRLKAVGNAVVPQVSEYVGWLIVDAHARNVDATVVSDEFMQGGADAIRNFGAVTAPTVAHVIVGEGDCHGESGHAVDGSSRPQEVNKPAQRVLREGVA